MSKIPKIDIIQCDETLDEVATKAYARRMRAKLGEDNPEILTRMELVGRLTVDEESLKGKNILILLPSREFHKYLNDIIVSAGILSVSGMSITLGAIDRNNIPWFLPNCSIENLDWLNDLMKELEHAKCMSERYKQSIVGSSKKFPIGTLQWGLSQQFQNQHATYVNSLDVAVTSFIEDDLNTSIITFPVEATNDKSIRRLAKSKYIYNLHEEFDLVEGELNPELQDHRLVSVLNKFAPDNVIKPITRSMLSVIHNGDLIILIPPTVSVESFIADKREILEPLLKQARTISIVSSGDSGVRETEFAEYMIIDDYDELTRIWGMVESEQGWDEEMRKQFRTTHVRALPSLIGPLDN